MGGFFQKRCVEIEATSGEAKWIRGPWYRSKVKLAKQATQIELAPLNDEIVHGIGSQRRIMVSAILAPRSRVVAAARSRSQAKDWR